MRILSIALAALFVFGPLAASARSYHRHSYSSHRSYHDTPGYYRNVDGDMIHRPMHSSRSLSGATATCGDGSQSFSRHHRGTCSHHGGVASYL